MRSGLCIDIVRRIKERDCLKTKIIVIKGKLKNLGTQFLSVLYMNIFSIWYGIVYNLLFNEYIYLCVPFSVYKMFHGNVWIGLKLSTFSNLTETEQLKKCSKNLL